MRIKCDFHIHSKYSADGIMEPGEILYLAKRKGYNAIAVADHNTCEGYRACARHAKEEGSGILVVPAAEYATEKGHIVALFVEKELGERYLRPVVDGSHFEFEGVVEGIRTAGGMAVFAHPFKETNSDPSDIKRLEGADVIEVFNARASCKRAVDANYNALSARQALGKPFSCGSDAHVKGEIGNAELYLEVEELTLPEVRKAILRADGDVYGRDGFALHSAVSAFNNNIRSQKKYKKLPRQIIYMLWALCIDILKALRLIRKNRYSCYIKGGVAVDLSDKTRKKN